MPPCLCSAGPISSGWRRGQTWGLKGCPFVSVAPWVFWEQEGCESPACPLSSKMPGPLLATGRAFVAAWAQERGQARAWQGWAAEPGAQGLQNPHALWDGNGFSGDTVPRPSPPGSPAWRTGTQNAHACSAAAPAFRDPQGGGFPCRNHRGRLPSETPVGECAGGGGMSLSPFPFVAPFTLCSLCLEVHMNVYLSVDAHVSTLALVGAGTCRCVCVRASCGSTCVDTCS